MHTCLQRIGDHILNPVGSCCTKRSQKYPPSTSAHDFVLRLPLALYASIHLIQVWDQPLNARQQRCHVNKYKATFKTFRSQNTLIRSDLFGLWLKMLWFDKLQSNGAALFTSTLSNRHVLALWNIYWISLLLPFPHLVHRVHISLISMLLLTKAPFGLRLRMSLNADILLYKSKRCDLEYIQSWVLSQCYTYSSCRMFVFIPHISSTLPVLPSISSLWSTCSYVTLIKLHYAVMQCRAELLPLMLFILVLIVTFLTFLQLGKPFFPQVASCGSSLPTGRRVSFGPCRSLLGARVSGHPLSAEDAEYLPPLPPENELG